MHDAGASSSEPLGSSVFEVCQGLCDMKNPRGVIFPMPDDSEYTYCYTYIHHASIAALFASADAGCTMCKMIGDRSGWGARGAARKRSEDIEQTVPNESAQTNSAAHTILCDEDVETAIELAKLTGRERLYSKNDWLIHCTGRIIVQWSLRNKSDLAGTAMAGLYACVLNPTTPTSTNPKGLSCFGVSLTCLITPCDIIDPNLEHRPSKDLLSEGHIDLINSWRHKCQAEHESCRRTAYDQLLPGRVLELLDPSDDKKGVRLIETKRKMQGTYACLSYCWGSAETQIGQTTRENLSRYLQHIPFNELPPTVIDAILLCFKLGFQFLWVDRLCIVQDDQEDWSEEASRMCEVYSKSALTVSVPLCKASSQSFLAERLNGFQEENDFIVINHKEEESKPRSSAWVYNTDPSVKHTWKRMGPWFLEDDWRQFRGRYYGDKRKSWLNRGWTYQEWMLSPRVLHIDSMTLWDCFSGYANELNRRYMGDPYLVRNPEGIEKDLGFTWKQLVEEFTRREVSREEDRLPALAGLAARHAQATGDTYVAGLWRENLHWWLLWEPREYYGGAQPAPKRHAPSWSWASLGRELEFWDPSHMFETDASIVSVFCQYDPPDSFSTIQKAWIDIECGISSATDQTSKDAEVRFWSADEWWYAIPDYRWEDLGDPINEGKMRILHLQQDSEAITALLLQEHGWEDGLQCFQRVGLAQPVQNGLRRYLPVPEMRQIVRLV